MNQCSSKGIPSSGRATLANYMCAIHCL